MQRFILSIIFTILIGSAWTQDVALSDDPQRTGRFGFGILEPLRQMFCNNSCKSTESMMYIMDLACLLKCPELYVEHNHQQSTTAVPSPTIPSATTVATAVPAATIVPSVPAATPAITTPAIPVTTAVPATTIVPSVPAAIPATTPSGTSVTTAGNGTITTTTGAPSG